MSKQSRLRRLQLPQEARNVDNAQGSHLWAYNHFRTNVLTSLLNDLIDLENEGLDENYCKEVRRSLEYFINASTNIPKGGFLSGGPLYLEIDSFAKTYKEWNDVNGQDPDYIKKRRALIKSLRKKRQTISNKVRRLQYELENNLDQKILTDTYNVIDDLIKLVPNLFKNLTSSYKDYLKATG